MDELNKALNNLPDNIRQKVIRPAVKAACSPLESAYRNFLERHKSRFDRPHTVEFVTSKVWRAPAGNAFVGIVGIRRGHAQLVHLLEKGTDERYTKAGEYRGRGPRLELLYKAFTVAKSQVQNILEQELTNRLQKLST